MLHGLQSKFRHIRPLATIPIVCHETSCVEQPASAMKHNKTTIEVGLTQAFHKTEASELLPGMNIDLTTWEPCKI
jgi:hypothetical protein